MGRVAWIGGENMGGGRSTLEMSVVRGAEGRGLEDGGGLWFVLQLGFAMATLGVDVVVEVDLRVRVGLELVVRLGLRVGRGKVLGYG